MKLRCIFPIVKNFIDFFPNYFYTAYMRTYTEEHAWMVFNDKLRVMKQKDALAQMGLSRQALWLAKLSQRMTPQMAHWAGFSIVTETRRRFVRRGK